MSKEDRISKEDENVLISSTINDKRPNLDGVREATTSVSTVDRNVMYGSTIPLILDGKFFKIISLHDKNVQAECIHCKRTIKGCINATTNFLNHLNIKGHSLTRYHEYKDSVQKNKSHKRICEDNTDNSEKENKSQAASKRQKQASLGTAFSRSSQKVADELISSFVVETMSPLSIVEHDAFKKLVNGINKLTAPITVMTRKTLRLRLDRMYFEMRKNVLTTLQSTKYVCTTTDVWSSSKRSFLGETAH